MLYYCIYTAAAGLALTVILHLLNFKNVEDKDTMYIYNLAFIALKQEPEYREHIIAFMLSIEVGIYDFCICSRYVKLSIRKFC